MNDRRSLSFGRRAAIFPVLAAAAMVVAGCSPGTGGGEGSSPTPAGQGEPGLDGVDSVGAGGRGGAPEPDGPLVVGMELSYPPFETVDADGNPDGVGVRMAEALAEFLGRPLEIRNIQFDGLITALKTGKVDCVISSMTANDERRRSIDFSEPYVRTGICLLVPAGSDVEGVDDLRNPGRRVAVKLATTGEMFARKHLPDADLVVLDQDVACVMEVVQSKVDAFIYDQLSIFNYHRKHPEATRALLEPIRDEVWAVGLRKGNDALRTQVNAFLEAFRASGGFERLAERYLSDEKAMLEEQGIPFIF